MNVPLTTQDFIDRAAVAYGTSTAVVDERLRVRGLQGLRVAGIVLQAIESLLEQQALGGTSGIVCGRADALAGTHLLLDGAELRLLAAEGRQPLELIGAG